MIFSPSYDDKRGQKSLKITKIKEIDINQNLFFKKKMF